ncbi:MAG: hypothetical protein HC879_15415 [Leptolyngbyaceae cyanobacterium SL_5_9]|nr:hypothetical protein [Leptolyngbyaceae cyanobacterium SL_5_9]NJO75784.1 hypothetical protein [Leptolyngbyaceae cyanobacterium RM1_406_9]
MDRLFSFFKKLKLRQILSVLIVGTALFLTTACNTGNMQGARPQNPPVQLGGNNNPHKGGGDGYTNYRMSTDPAVNQSDRQGDRASLPSSSNQLVASGGIESNASDLLYPGSSATDTKNPDIGPVDSEILKREAQQVPARRQLSIDRNDPDAKILERTGEAFKDASEFLTDMGKSAAEQPELQRNPAFAR